MRNVIRISEAKPVDPAVGRVTDNGTPSVANTRTQPSTTQRRRSIRQTFHVRRQ